MQKSVRPEVAKGEDDFLLVPMLLRGNEYRAIQRQAPGAGPPKKIGSHARVWESERVIEKGI
jgi:hypothetical protein